MTISTAAMLLSPLFLLLDATNALAAPKYNAAGELIAPKDYREWVFLSSGVNMNYSETPIGMDHAMVDNVFVDPVSWQAFKKTGRWPEGTTFVKESRVGSSKGSINKSGIFQTEERFDLEVHVRDSKRFKTGWGFFIHEADKPAKVLPANTSCYSCHITHGAVQTTFVQFYPTARPIAIKAGTFDRRK
ncbi:cytochrome P460 family protein [Sandarakinorhabdus sp.]|uniref:cytochrome P460 family protein n=1 Tax=Sandarakinorhabdus sp. TaxID=1916663 RepID=UPI00286E7684|nr:cytochrome P460 family protein [Sandarakinorhabdus sp.]